MIQRSLSQLVVGIFFADCVWAGANGGVGFVDAVRHERPAGPDYFVSKQEIAGMSRESFAPGAAAGGAVEARPSVEGLVPAAEPAEGMFGVDGFVPAGVVESWGPGPWPTTSASAEAQLSLRRSFELQAANPDCGGPSIGCMVGPGSAPRPVALVELVRKSEVTVVGRVVSVTPGLHRRLGGSVVSVVALEIETVLVDTKDVLTPVQRVVYVQESGSVQAFGRTACSLGPPGVDDAVVGELRLLVGSWNRLGQHVSRWYVLPVRDGHTIEQSYPLVTDQAMSVDVLQALAEPAIE
jgi:hypothetical protein